MAKTYNYNGERIWFQKGAYADNGTLALLAMCAEGPYAHFTVNLADPALPGCAFVDTNNLGNGVCSFLMDNGIASPTGREQRSGFCTFPEYMFDPDFLDDCDEIA